MKRTLVFTLIGLTTLTFACKKNNSGPSAGYGPNSLFPTTNGDTWYFMDSAFNDTTGLIVAYPDTMVATKTAVTDNAGTVYLEMYNPYGWFSGSYISVDPTNTAVYEEDSITNFQPYTMFALVNQDGPVTQPYVDYANAACPVTYTQIGYAAPVQAYGYSCYKNTEIVTNCSNTVLEQTDYFLSPGVGVVRIDDWVTDTTGGANKFYEDYSQTLTAKSLK